MSEMKSKWIPPIKERWVLIYDKYEGFYERAANKLAGALSGQVGYVIPAFSENDATDELIASNNVAFVGDKDSNYLSKLIADCVIKAPSASQGYSLKVCDSPFNSEFKTILVCGFDAIGTLYGAVDFYNHYMGSVMYRHGAAEVTQEKYFDIPLTKKTPDFELCSAPAISQRAIWTWGHCIYDYRNFFQNMLSLKLNQAVIWNDFAPLNGKAIVDYAHSLGITVYWGFSWGWGNNNNCLQEGERIDSDDLIARWAENVYTDYRDNYECTGADGIYFQSFTETKSENLDGILIAPTVVKWVNTISARLFETYPELDIEFGLHATSVNTHLDDIAKVDSRISIVWEDCGAFPYNYNPEALSDFDETVELNRVICTLRGEDEKFGAVLKGMTKLDWHKFENQLGSYIMGENDTRFIGKRSEMKEKIWRNIQSYWIENSEYAQKIISDIAKYTRGTASVQMLVEDGCFEDGVFFPVALCSELMWSPDGNLLHTIGETARFPLVRFTNI